MEASRDIEMLLEIMSRLRDKESGCPWDVEQTFSSIIPYTIEEAYEVQDAIERKDLDDMREELGDLLLQVVFHAQMAKEQDAFNFGDVVHAITKKMVRRHPHVFGDAQMRGKALVKGAWEAIKAEEKQERQQRRAALGFDDEAKKAFLDDVPRGMPAMKAATKLQKQASKVGFDWNDPALVLDKIEEETQEVKQELQALQQQDASLDSLAMKSEIGDLLFAVINLARQCHIDPDEALAITNQKFRDRFGHVEQRLNEDNISLQEASLDQMESLWQSAKSLT
ncbi:MAG: nucleoside triphosphate pyrophosphohydrolase [Cohaesibacter sp.]|nr:nucleoside triphosphate pyrophosphohydrolase [Cohaesibacter sp.]